MHLMVDSDVEEFFAFSKMRWTNMNPDKTLKVYGVKDESLLQYNQNPKLNIVYELAKPIDLESPH